MPAIATTLKGLICAAVAAATLLPAQAQAPAEPVLFAGKQIKLLIGFSPTGYGYDTYGRLLARHLTRHLPGHPTIVIQNMPSAAGVGATNFVYEKAEPDGMTILFNSWDPLAQALGLSPAQLQNTLPADVALIDFLEYTHYPSRTKEKGEQPHRRMTAFIVRRDAMTRITCKSAGRSSCAMDSNG